MLIRRQNACRAILQCASELLKDLLAFSLEHGGVPDIRTPESLLDRACPSDVHRQSFRPGPLETSSTHRQRAPPISKRSDGPPSKFSFIVRAIPSTVLTPASMNPIALRLTHRRMLHNCSHAWNGITKLRQLVYEVFQCLLLITISEYHLEFPT